MYSLAAPSRAGGSEPDAWQEKNGRRAGKLGERIKARKNENAAATGSSVIHRSSATIVEAEGIRGDSDDEPNLNTDGIENTGQDKDMVKFLERRLVPLAVAVAMLTAAGTIGANAAQAADWPFDVTTVRAPDGSITAKFVSFGATMTELWVRDREGNARDVVLGYDDNTKLLADPAHPVFNPIVGRYANRIKNGTFSIPITKDPQPDGPNVYHIPTNDHDGQDTLHGGIYGWDRRNWTVLARTDTSVTYHHLDAADEGFPGDVDATVTHSVESGGVLRTSVHATATEKTPIMLTQHIYWNLDAFQGPGSDDVLAHTLRVAASRVVAVDGDAIPTGPFIDVAGTPFDFREAQPIGARWDETVGLCGGGCQGYDNCWIYDGSEEEAKPGVSLWSDLSGIRLDVTTDNPAVQVYTGYWLDTPRKVVHGGPDVNYTKWSAVAIEQEGYIDAINTPEWGVDQIYYPGKDYTWQSVYRFSTVPA